MSDLATTAERQTLPAGWRWATIADVCEPKTAPWDPRRAPHTPFHYVDITTVDRRLKRIGQPQYLLGQDAPSRARQVVRTGDVLVATTRPNLNAVAVVPESLDRQVCSTGFAVLRPRRTRVTTEFLFAYVRSALFVERLSELVRGALYPAVTEGQVRSQQIPLPPLPEQRRIVARLTTQLGEVERAQAAVEAQQAAARALPAAYLRKVFPRPSASLPPGWRWVRLGEVCQFFSGGTPSKRATEFWTGSIPWVSPKDVKSETVAVTIDHISLEAVDDSATRLVPAGSLLVVVRSGILAHSLPMAVTGTTVSFNQDVKALVPTTDILPAFLLRALQSLRPYVLAHGVKKGATVHSLKSGFLENLPIPLPALPEQRRIGAWLTAQMAEMDRVATALDRTRALVAAVPPRLLQDALTGGL